MVVETEWDEAFDAPGGAMTAGRADREAALRAENERLRASLTWYGDEAEAIGRRLNGATVVDNPKAVEASLVVLALDAGKRAREALGVDEQST